MIGYNKFFFLKYEYVQIILKTVSNIVSIVKYPCNIEKIKDDKIIAKMLFIFLFISSYKPNLNIISSVIGATIHLATKKKIILNKVISNDTSVCERFKCTWNCSNIILKKNERHVILIKNL